MQITKDFAGGMYVRVADMGVLMDDGAEVEGEARLYAEDIVEILSVLQVNEVKAILADTFEGRGWGEGLLEQLDLEDEAITYAEKGFILLDKSEAPPSEEAFNAIKTFLDIYREEFDAFCLSRVLSNESRDVRAWIQGVA